MSELITNVQVIEAFKEAAKCEGARDCKQVAQAMCKLFRLDNQHTLETGERRITFASEPEGPCPNQDQLFCQDLDQLQ